MSERTYPRFSRAQRIEHLILLTSFTILGLTGLPQKFSGEGWAQALIGIMGGIETTRVIHRVAAIVLMLESVYHIVSVGYRVFVRRVRPTMIPTVGDVGEAIGALLYNLGLKKEKPQGGRYTFGEKLEYWAVVWGTGIMVLTGFMLWNPIATTNLLPGEVVPAAKTAHGGEALLAVLAIVIWHMYHVHARHFNKSMFTGRLTEHEMLEEHPRELADIKAGLAHRPLDPAQLQKRRQRYYPVAGVLAVVLLFGLSQFVTFEKTAIDTVPTREQVAAFLPLTPTPLPTPRPSATPAALSPVWDGNLAVVLQERCGDCHGGTAGLDFSTYQAALQGGNNGPVIVSGDPDNSPIVLKIAAGRHPGKLSDAELNALKQWIEAGAPEE
ncbi:MAG TPA: c-type cytochrome domain-containing protein [Anaerolineae bacterium]|nr:c-type cytochrome domain-containing protein [Anaerolineae bacterium]